MKYTFFCDKSNRFAFTKEYKTKAGLKRAIARLEKEGWRVTITRLTQVTIYQDGKFTNKYV